MNCVFCKIAGGEIPAKTLFEDEKIMAFYDAEPQAPVHFLVIPKQHISGMDQLTEENAALVGHIYAVIARLAAELELEHGFRVVCNYGEHGSQTVPHLHFHVLGGRSMTWPPG